jgi:hypothetical protein
MNPFETNRFGPGLSSRARFWRDLFHELDRIHFTQEELEIIGPTPAQVFAGNVTYRTSTGWTFVIFNDCDSFDYIDNATAPDGRDFQKEWGESYVEYQETLYSPDDDELSKVWGFPPRPTRD